MSSPNPHAIDADTLSGMKPLRKVVYSIGSNLGDRLGNVQGAVDALSDTPDVIVVDVSSVYETTPVGGPPDSPEFLNIVVIAETTLEPRTLVERAFAIEEAYGRTRDGDRCVEGIWWHEQLCDPHGRSVERARCFHGWPRKWKRQWEGTSLDPGSQEPDP